MFMIGRSTRIINQESQASTTARNERYRDSFDQRSKSKTVIDHVVFVLQAVKAQDTTRGGEGNQGQPHGS